MKLIRLLLGAFYFFVTSCSDEPKSSVPEFIAKQFDGDTVNLKSIAKNKVTVIFFWTTFCDNCLTELSNIHYLYDRYKDNKKFNFITIAHNTDAELKQFNSSKDTTNPYQQYLKDLKFGKFDLPILVGSNAGYEIYPQNDGSFIAGIKDTSEVGKLYTLFGFKGLPTTIIYSAKGELVYKYSGPKTMKDDFEKYKIFLNTTIDSLMNH